MQIQSAVLKSMYISLGLPSYEPKVTCYLDQTEERPPFIRDLAVDLDLRELQRIKEHLKEKIQEAKCLGENEHYAIVNFNGEYVAATPGQFVQMCVK